MKSFYVITILLFSCSSKDNEIEQDLVKKEVQFNKDEYFHLFYPKFRDAVLTYNDDSLIKFTNFPVEVQGHLDDDPVLKLDKDEFLPIFKASIYDLTEVDPNKDEFEMCSTYHLFRETDDILEFKKFHLLDEYQLFGNLVFKKIDKVWKLTIFHTDTRKLKFK